MKKVLLGALAALLSGTGLSLSQPPASTPSVSEEAVQPAAPPAPITENAVPLPLATLPPVDPSPWNPSIQQGARRPYAEPAHGWLSGLCPDLGEFWLGADYLLWALRPARLPALVTTSPANSRGILGQPGTSVLLGHTDVNDQAFSGGQFTGGVWLDDDHIFGFEGSFFFLGQQSRNLSAASSGAVDSPTLARPFVNVLTNQEDAQLVAIPGQQAASMRVTTTTSLLGAEAIGSVGLLGGDHCCLEMLVGFRYLELKEELGIAQQINFLPSAPVNAGAQISQADQFDVRNHYYAGEVGLRGEACFKGFLLDVTGKVALGANEELVNIAGFSSFAPPLGMPLLSSGGVLALPTNLGRFTRSQFVAVPEFGCRLGYQLTSHVGLFAGYTLLYWSDVVRSGNQIDRGLNATQVPVVRPAGPLIGPARPAFAFRTTDFWAQGGTFGLEVRY